VVLNFRHDEIEDLDADERNLLVQRAFMHRAVREWRLTVWIPRDDIGVSDDEINIIVHVA
jgi:hypothetical protein